MTLGIDVQSWYATYFIKDITLDPENTYALLKNDRNRYIEKTKNLIIKNAREKFLHPEIQIFSTKNDDNEYFFLASPLSIKKPILIYLLLLVSDLKINYFQDNLYRLL